MDGLQLIVNPVYRCPAQSPVAKDYVRVNRDGTSNKTRDAAVNVGETVASRR
ncbi:hypothetical protein [Bordetella sp. H567]|uniref:hypothetical protein n=1 Tax=Bordetella sp. H567 TaxID=1697043 RepID=UPI001313DDE4|nr:hypothetical protein [Bordetella sp. H567]